MLDPAGLQAALLRLAQNWADELGDVVAVDGKVLRRSVENASERSPTHLLRAFASASNLTLAQVGMDGKSNEIPQQVLEAQPVTRTSDDRDTSPTPRWDSLCDCADRLWEGDAVLGQHSDYLGGQLATRPSPRFDVAVKLAPTFALVRTTSLGSQEISNFRS